MTANLTLDHVGYAVEAIEPYLADFFVPLYQPTHVTSPVDDPIQRVRIVFATLADHSRIELLQPLSTDSPVSAQVRARRGGLYHVGYTVSDLEGRIAQVQALGGLLVSGPVPAVAFDQRRIAFLLTPQRDLIEFIEA